jgi:choline dehydrogenase-like flavoprotein
VDESFRVHGFDNLFVCDASVFPTAITVNPQLTVMALANYAAPGIAEVPA